MSTKQKSARNPREESVILMPRLDCSWIRFRSRSARPVPKGQTLWLGQNEERRDRHATFGQVLSIHVYVDVGSPFGQPGGAVMFRIGIVIIRLGSRI